jgi:hypothetical protein
MDGRGLVAALSYAYPEYSNAQTRNASSRLNNSDYMTLWAGYKNAEANQEVHV